MGLAPASEALAVTWQEGYDRVAISISKDGGRPWRSRDRTVVSVDSEDELRNPQVAVAGDAAYVLWERWASREDSAKGLGDVMRARPKDDFVRRVDLRR